MAGEYRGFERDSNPHDCAHQDIQNIYAILARHDGRLARIERRLEITEPA